MFFKKKRVFKISRKVFFSFRGKEKEFMRVPKLCFFLFSTILASSSLTTSFIHEGESVVSHLAETRFNARNFFKAVIAWRRR